jgi:hypothetical protein
MKILRLTLYKKWFDEIASGRKTEEYREDKPYWSSRLNNFKQYDEIHFTNGYGANRPFMRVECKGYYKLQTDLSAKRFKYVILLGKVLEVKR